MPKESEPAKLSPTVLHYRGLDLDALASIQLRNIEMLRRMFALLLDSVEMMAARQVDFLKSTQDQVERLFEARATMPGAGESFSKRQAAIHREMFESVAKHAGELTEIAARCCGGTMEEFGAQAFTPVAQQAEESKPAKTSK